MNGKKAKLLRKEEQEKAADFEARQKLFMSDLQNLTTKHRIDIVSILEYKKNAILPAMTLVDMKDHYEHMTEEAKAAEAKKQAQNGELKPKVDAPKLEV